MNMKVAERARINRRKTLELIETMYKCDVTFYLLYIQ